MSGNFSKTGTLASYRFPSAFFGAANGPSGAWVLYVDDRPVSAEQWPEMTDQEINPFTGISWHWELASPPETVPNTSD